MRTNSQYNWQNHHCTKSTVVNHICCLDYCTKSLNLSALLIKLIHSTLGSFLFSKKKSLFTTFSVKELTCECMFLVQCTLVVSKSTPFTMKGHFFNFNDKIFKMNQIHITRKFFNWVHQIILLKDFRKFQANAFSQHMKKTKNKYF